MDQLSFFVLMGVVTAFVVAILRARHKQMAEGGEVRAARRAAGGALLTFQGFVAPGVEHVIEAQQVEAEDDAEPGEDPEIGPPTDATILAELGGLLAEAPVDAVAVRRVLIDANRAGLDWRRLYEEATRAELAARPYRAPWMPPAARVAPPG